MRSGSQKPKFLKESMNQNYTFQGDCEGGVGGGGGLKTKNHFVRGGWISLHNRILKDPSEASSLKILGDPQGERHSEE